ncbi:MAG: hypothetical protein QOE17_1065 [Gaiellales bacterium]|jgi:hypothetical protein|nr:hypothetical protein [Gaiellales bacterium]
MASSEWARELRLLDDPKMQAWVERAANRMVGELLSEGRFELCPPGVEPEGKPEFADRLIRCELALIADGAYPLRVALRIAVLRASRDVLQASAAIRALPESAGQLSSPPQAPAVAGRRRV